MTSDDRHSRKPHLSRRVARFGRDQDGAVTIDWVALTGFIIALGMGAAFYVASSVPRVAENVGDHLEATPVLPDS